MKKSNEQSAGQPSAHLAVRKPDRADEIAFLLLAVTGGESFSRRGAAVAIRFALREVFGYIQNAPYSDEAEMREYLLACLAEKYGVAPLPPKVVAGVAIG